MPQLDPALFSPQIVWLIITFAALYFLVSRLVMPRVDAVLEQREERIQGNLERAERIKQEAADVLAAYEKTIADARAEAHAALVKAAADVAAEATRRETEFGRKLAEQSATAEARIREAKTQAMAELHAIAGDVAAAMVAKLIGSSVGAVEARQAVDRVMQERA